MNKYISIGLFIMFTLLVSSGAYIGHLRYKLHDTAQGRDAAIADYRNITKYYTNSQGDLIAQTKSFELSKSEFNRSLKSNDLKWAKKFNDYKHTQAAQSFTTTYTTEKIVKDTFFIPCQDSIRAYKYHFKDAYNDISATVIDTPHFSIRDRYYVVVTKNRPSNWFIKLQWRKWEFKGQVANSNKLVKLDSIQTIIVR